MGRIYPVTFSLTFAHLVMMHSGLEFRFQSDFQQGEKNEAYLENQEQKL